SLLLPYPCPTPRLHSFPTRRSSDLAGTKPGPAAEVLLRWPQSERNAGAPSFAFFTKGGIPQIYNFLEVAETDVMRIVFSFSSYRSEEHTSELQSRENLVCRLLLEKK